MSTPISMYSNNVYMYNNNMYVYTLLLLYVVMWHASFGAEPHHVA